MKCRRRIRYTAEQRAEIWDRWQRGESMNSIGRAFDQHAHDQFGIDRGSTQMAVEGA